MLLAALVLSNSEFLDSGKIKVRVASKYLGKMTWDLSKNLSFLFEGDSSNDSYAYVFTPFGTGKNSSMYWLPRVNSIGLVSPLGGDNSSQFVWLGGYFQSPSSIPSQNLDDYAYGSNIYDENSFVFRTKTTGNVEFAEAGKEKELDWDKKDTENLIIINEDGIQIRHFLEVNKDKKAISYQDVFIGTRSTKDDNGEITKTEKITEIVNMTNSGKDEEKYSTIQMGDLGVFFTDFNKKEKVTSTIAFDKKGISMVSLDEKKQSGNYSKLSVAGGKISASIDSTSIEMTDKNITISADATVTLAAKNVRLGGGNGKVVTTQSFFQNFKTFDGIVLSASDAIMG